MQQINVQTQNKDLVNRDKTVFDYTSQTRTYVSITKALSKQPNVGTKPSTVDEKCDDSQKLQQNTLSKPLSVLLKHLPFPTATKPGSLQCHLPHSLSMRACSANGPSR